MIYVVIPVHNRKTYTRDCLLCLRQQTYRDFQTIVIDDGSTDGTTELLANEFPEVTVLRGDGNLWWTRAINKGVQYALKKSSNVPGDAVLTLNDDLVIKPTYISTLYADYQANKPCLMGSVVVDINNPTYLEYAGTRCNYLTAKVLPNARLFKDYQQLRAAHQTIQSDDLSGRGTLIPLSVFKQVGLYDERNFPHYMADIELSVRARRAGYTLYVSTGAVVHNYMEATRNKRQSIRDFVAGFWSFRSPHYIRSRYTFAIAHSPLKQLYFLADLSRLVIGFPFRR